MNVLVIGGTGTLGRQIVKKALDKGYKVKCLVRNLRRGNFLKEWGAELIYGDLSIPETLPPTLKGINIVIDASTVRPADSYNAETIDGKGKIALIEASKLANIKKFIFFSMLDASKNKNIPLLDLKVKTENSLKESGLNYTVFQCSGFFQGLINQYAIPILEKQTIWLLGNSAPVAYLDTLDAAEAVVKSIPDSKANKKNFILTGNRFWSSEEIIQLCERLSGNKAKISYIPSFTLFFLRKILRFFELTWNIADRLQFSEITNSTKISPNQREENSWLTEKTTLEQYLQEYFGNILKKLKETNYQQSQKNNEISFL